MITYVDTSTLLKLLIDEDGSDRAELIWDTADALAAASLVTVEARAALAAAVQARRLPPAQHRRAKTELDQLVAGLNVLAVTGRLVAEAGDLAEAEALRGYDAAHLAAALTVGAEILTSAERALCEAARHRGLHVANPTDP